MVETGNECQVWRTTCCHTVSVATKVWCTSKLSTSSFLGLLNNTLPAEHETSKLLVGLWSGNRARRAQCVPRDVTWHRLNAHSCKESVDIPPLIAVWYQAWCQGVASGSVKDKRVLHTIHVFNLSHPVVSGELHARLKCCVVETRVTQRASCCR